MYQVIKMYGNWEAWWFLEGWQEDLVGQESFATFEEALSAYETEWQLLKDRYPSYKSQNNLLASFWDKEDREWCEECADYLQNYDSLLLLKDGKALPKDYVIADFERANDQPEQPSDCVINLEKSSPKVFPFREEVRGRSLSASRK